MYNVEKLIKIGTSDLLQFLKKEGELVKDSKGVLVELELDRKPTHWINLGCIEEGDVPFNWYITGIFPMLGERGLTHIYQGKVLVRNRKVKYYDRYPIGGGPFEVSDFTDENFRKKSEVIVKNINQLLGCD